MAEKILKQVYIPNLTVKGDIMQQIGTNENGVLFPERPFEITIGFDDFKDKEEYATLYRILTQVCREKVTAIYESGKSNSSKKS